MQQLGHDYELLLASHRSVYMDVDSGNILDSGTVSPVENSKSSTNLQSVYCKKMEIWFYSEM